MSTRSGMTNSSWEGRMTNPILAICFRIVRAAFTPEGTLVEMETLQPHRAGSIHYLALHRKFANHCQPLPF